MFYPKNFPKKFEKPLIQILKNLEHEFDVKKPANQKQFTRLLLNQLKGKKMNNILGDTVPSLWWIRFILLRHRSLYTQSFINAVGGFLTKTKTRSLSGIVPLTLFTKGTGCPFACIYCPNEPGIPKSYLSDEPAVMRALRHRFDPYKQTLNRLVMFYLANHPIDKIEIIIKGGTFSFYEKKYRGRFVKRIFDACNTDIAYFISTGTIRLKKTEDLSAAQKANETAASRVIGINIETRPDYINKPELQFLRKLGVTHVELGVQMPDDEIYRLIRRGHTVANVIDATLLLKDYGFKVGYHLMPNLPGSYPEKDKLLMEQIYGSCAYKPDHLKLYPTTVTKYTTLADWFKKGRYKPYSLEELLDVIVTFKIHVPLWMRIGRLTRDITTTMMEHRQFPPNLRELIQNKMNKASQRCQCIRCREIRDNPISGKPKMRIITYPASSGMEYFLEFIDDVYHSLGFLRLRITSTNDAIVRELHVYGQSTPIGKRYDTKIQHHNLGESLLKKAEDITRGLHISKLSVISGVGAREYYRKLGYSLKKTYMVKNLANA